MAARWEPLATTRRGVLLLSVGVGVGACGVSPTAKPSASPSQTPVPEEPTESASRRADLPAVTVWQPGAGELVPEAKLAAVRRVEAMGNDATHRVQVIDAQYGGLLATSASVLVPTRSWALSGGALVEDGQTFDVRVSLSSAPWTVGAIYPSEPGGAAASVSEVAKEVLASPRISLPPAARADLESGHVHDSVCAAMLAVAAHWKVDVSVVRSGHPQYVFGTSRPSDHPQGKAFDTWAIDGHPVVSPSTSSSLVTEYMHALAAAGSYNVGGPILLGSAPQYFSDNTHHDHVHAGFSS